MTNTVRFTKMQGAGNDYIYVDTLLNNIPDPASAAVSWSAPHTGIGADGLVLIGRADGAEADFTMRIFNADGSEALMCGNAARCVGKYLYEKGITGKTLLRLLTPSGVKLLRLRVGAGNVVESVTVDMLAPVLADPGLLAAPGGSMREGRVVAGGRAFSGTFVSMGNPHFVIFADNAEAVDVARWGALIERLPLFPCRCNVEFASVMADGLLRVRVWERGSGVTMACGTGACATAVAAVLTGRAPRAARVVMDGGTLGVEWSATDGHVYLSGPAEVVFEGEAQLA